MIKKLGPYLLGPNDTPENGIYTGDARELAKAIPDESVDLVFTDPIYQNIDDYRWLAETAARVLKSGGSCLAYCGNMHQVEVGAVMLDALKPRPTLYNFMCPPYLRLFEPKCHVNVMPLLWFGKNRATPRKWVTLQYSSSYHHKFFGHKWGKNIAACYHWINSFVSTDAIVFDPFTGGGTTPAACKMLGRNYVAFEIDPQTAQDARNQVVNTQPPLSLSEPEFEQQTFI